MYRSLALAAALPLALAATPATAQVGDPRALCEQQTTAIAREDSKLAIQLAQNGSSVALSDTYKKFLVKAVDEIKSTYGAAANLQLGGSVGEMGDTAGYYILGYTLNDSPLYFVCAVAKLKAGGWMVVHTTYNTHLGPVLQTALKR